MGHCQPLDRSCVVSRPPLSFWVPDGKHSCCRRLDFYPGRGCPARLKDSAFRMLDQLNPSSEQFTSPTGLRVRQDLYDEDYSDEDYEQMLSMYEGTMSQIVEGEIVKSKVLRVTDNAV